MGKSQVSKYESGRELPKLHTLAALLEAVGVGVFEFWYIVSLIDGGEAQLGQADQSILPMPPLPLSGPGLMSSETDIAFKRLMDDVMKIYHQISIERIRELSKGS